MNSLPPNISFVAALINRAEPKRVICVGDSADVIRTALGAGLEVIQFTSSPAAFALRREGNRAAAGRLQVKLVNLEQGIDIDASMLEGAIVIALDILDKLVTPAPLIECLAKVRGSCQFMLLNATDRVRALGFVSRGNGKIVDFLPRWSGEEFFEELVRCGFPDSSLFGFTSGHFEGHPKDMALAIAGREAEHAVQRAAFRTAAVLNVFNEVDVIDETVRYLASQGIEVHVIDNWSEDGTYELAQSLLDGGLVKTLSRFPEKRTGDYEWAKQLTHAAEFAASLDADWLLHYDADEIRCTPWKDVTLRDGIAFVDSLGYTAIDFTILDFRFTEQDATLPLSARKHFEFARHHPSSFVQIKAWKNSGIPVDLVTQGGHEALFVGQKVYPLKFLTKHYSLRSAEQATRKVFRDRLPRIGKERAERGWHVHFDPYRHLDRIEPWSVSEVMFYQERTFAHDFLLERLSGIGVDRETRIALNRNTSAMLHDVATQLTDKVSSLQSELSARDESIAETRRQLEELNRQTAQLNEAVSLREARVAALEHRLSEQSSLIVSLEQAAERRDAQIDNLHQVSRAGELAYQQQAEQLENARFELQLRSELIERLHIDVGSRDRRVEGLTHAAAARAAEIHHLEQGVKDARAELEKVLASKSWQVTKPLRFLRRNTVTRLNRSFRKSASDMGRWFWYNLPASTATKQQVKSFVFGNFPVLFRGTIAYRSWMNFTAANCAEVLPTVHRKAAPGLLANEYVPLLAGKPIESKPAKLICFYLPQFHSIPENDGWWGDGFTEWSNVRPARPQFSGHYQPHVPGELGYYSLLNPAVQQRQVELAQLYGIAGFCFYFYWFGGKRLLETPTRNYLENPSLSLPFCLCWANENWSRRWDGAHHDVLIAQNHSPEDDLAFIEYVAQYMRDPRYIRVGGKPLLVVYRPCLLPAATETAARWRQWCRANGIGEICLAYTQSFETVPPEKYGFDAAIEFPPNNSSPPNVTDTVESAGENFGCTVYDWNVFIERSKSYAQPRYKLYRSVCPAWDNTPRRKNNSTVFLNSNPDSYRQWLANAIQETQRQFSDPDERLVFVNAWNEWAEGAYLEPDARYGYAYLQATRDALTGESSKSSSTKRRIVIVAHDGYPHGAQLLALHLAQTLSRDFDFHVDMVCLGEGPLRADYAKFAVLHDLAGQDPQGEAARRLAETLYRNGHRAALVNTTVSGYFLGTLADAGIDCVALIHELGGVIEQYQLQSHTRVIAQRAVKVVFAAEEVAACFQNIASVDPSKLAIRPQGLYKRRTNARERATLRTALRERLGLAAETLIVLGVGYADHRKGIDLFVEAGMAMAKRVPQARWVWIGHWDGAMKAKVDQLLASDPSLNSTFVFPGIQQDTELFYGGADLFALTSREDPFPSVVLEAMDACLPVVAFEGAGGFADLLRQGCGCLVPLEDASAMANEVTGLLRDPIRRRALGDRGAAIVSERFSFRHYLFDLLDMAGVGIPRVSVVVPNYNYEHYLGERLQTILNHDYPIFEILFLDDCSKDGSVNFARESLASSHIDCRIVVNEKNSGSAFAQWKKGVDLARGDYVWIAEADDSTDAGFLTEVIKGFDDPGVVLSYCESKQIDENGHILADNYHDYVADIGAERWHRHFVNDGLTEISEALSVKNTIPNVSGVVFKKDRLQAVLNDHMPSIRSFSVAGDWLVYVLLLRSGNVAFSPRALNNHRRHTGGLTIGTLRESLFNEIRRMQLLVSEEFDVPPQTAITARRYLDDLTKHMGVTSN